MPMIAEPRADRFDYAPSSRRTISMTPRKIVRPAKVDLDVRFTRYRADNSAIGAFRSLSIVTRDDGRWAVAARSSFAD